MIRSLTGFTFNGCSTRLQTSSLDAAVILAQDNVYDDAGKRMDCGTFYVPNEYVLALAREHREFPAGGFDSSGPGKDAQEELERCFGRWGGDVEDSAEIATTIDCNDRRYQKFGSGWRRRKLPLLAHTGGEHTLHVVRPEFTGPARVGVAARMRRDLPSRHTWQGRAGWWMRTTSTCSFEMMRRYPNLSATSAHLTFRRGVNTFCVVSIWNASCTAAIIRCRCLGIGRGMRGLVNWETFRRWEREPNVLERDYQLKRAIGFRDETFTRVANLLRVRA